MSLETIKSVGPDAFLQGFLNKDFANSVIDRANLFCNMRVIMPTGYTDALFKAAKEGIVLDLSTALPPLASVYMAMNGIRALVRIPILT